MTKLWVCYVLNFPHSFVSFSARISIQQYRSTRARNDGDLRVERDAFLCEKHRHNDCSEIRLFTPPGRNMLFAVSRRKTSLPCCWVWSLHCCGVGLSNRHKNSTGRTSSYYVVRNGMSWLLEPYSTMVIFRHSRDFPFYFWEFIFNFGCIPGTLSAASRRSFTEKR